MDTCTVTLSWKGNMMRRIDLLTVSLCFALVFSSGAAQTARLRSPPLYAHRSDILSVDFSPDGTVLASGSRDKTVKLWKTADGSLLRELPAFKGRVTAVAFSPTEDVLATVSLAGAI